MLLAIAEAPAEHAILGRPLPPQLVELLRIRSLHSACSETRQCGHVAKTWSAQGQLHNKCAGYSACCPHSPQHRVILSACDADDVLASWTHRKSRSRCLCMPASEACPQQRTQPKKCRREIDFYSSPVAYPRTAEAQGNTSAFAYARMQTTVLTSLYRFIAHTCCRQHVSAQADGLIHAYT